MPKRVAIVQSNYIPWKGYFDLMRLADEFVLYDDVQYTRRDWRNRNKIKTANGVQWLTVPVEVKGKYTQTIRETRVSEPGWAADHWTRLKHAYAKAPHFRDYADALGAVYAGLASPWLSEVNETLIRWVAAELGVPSKITQSNIYDLTAADPTQRLADICKQAGATAYLSGPAAKAYLDESVFAAAGVSVEYMDYAGYPEYPQVHPPFEHAVTALDLLFHAGRAAGRFMERTPRAA